MILNAPESDERAPGPAKQRFRRDLSGQTRMPANLSALQREVTRTTSERVAPFHDRFVELFDAHFGRLFRYLDRLCGEPDLAADVAQDVFVRLYGRGSMPDSPEAWLISVAMNLLRNARSTQSRRSRLLTIARGERVHSDAAPSPVQAAASEQARRRVHKAIDQFPERERQLLLLWAEGYSYRHIAQALGLNEASVGTLLARARRAFRTYCEDDDDAPR